ncbi:MAG: hypothetical protein EBS53_16130 [Bacteroidetes bacterium]|nr:hypothetical protein [Bacteroidota bacterium]
MSKTFSHAGVSKLNGEFKVRFANDALRTKVLIKNDHTDIDIIELPTPMTKEDAVAYLISIDFATKNTERNEEVHAALLAEVDKRSDKPEGASKDKPRKEAKKPKKPAKPTMEGIKAKVEAKKAATPKTTLTKAEIEAQLADMDEAPF